MLCISKNKNSNLTEYRIKTKPMGDAIDSVLPPLPKLACPNKIKYDVWYEKQKKHIDLMFATLTHHLSVLVLYEQSIEVKSTLYEEFCRYLYNTSNTSKSFFKLL